MLSNGSIRFYIIIIITVIVVKLLNVYMKKHEVKEKRHTTFQIITIAITIGLGMLADEWAVKQYGDQIGGFFEHTGYTADYYVNVFENNKTTKNYQLIASIYRDEEYGDYQINYFTWPNGGYSEFYNNSYDNPLIVGEKVEIKDDNNKTWFIQLTNNKANP
jgi:hypothetical protein